MPPPVLMVSAAEVEFLFGHERMVVLRRSGGGYLALGTLVVTARTPRKRGKEYDRVIKAEVKT